MQGQEFDFRELLLIVKKKILNICVITILAAVLGGMISNYCITPKYEASINMIVNARQNANVNVTSDDLTSAEKLVDTYAIIIKGNIVLNQVIEQLELEKSYAALNSQVEVKSVNNTQVMKITVTDTELDMAKKIVEAITEIAPPIIVDAVEAGSCKVVSLVEANESPSTPNIQKCMLISGFLGFLFYTAWVVLKSLFDDTIGNEEDVQTKIGIPVLGIIPDIEE